MKKADFIDMLENLDDATEICALDAETLEMRPVTGMIYGTGLRAELCTDSDEGESDEPKA